MRIFGWVSPAEMREEKQLAYALGFNEGLGLRNVVEDGADLMRLPWNVGKPAILWTPTPGQDVTRSLFPLSKRSD